MNHFKTISDYHKYRQLPKPLHPLISVIDLNDIHFLDSSESVNVSFDFFCVAVKRIFNFKIHYGQTRYDFDEGILFLMSPNQVYSLLLENGQTLQQSGWMLLIHPDFLWNTPLAQTISTFDFWKYAVNEALFLSEKEELKINSLIADIREEYGLPIDASSKKIMVSQIETLLHYAQRFYDRQFITREKGNHALLERFEKLVSDYYTQTDLRSGGIPTVKFFAGQLHLSPNYLSGVLRVLTGQNAQQHIHNLILGKAKEKLSISTLSVSEIAYELGFEHLQSFSKFFKSKTNLSPLAFRRSFN